MNRLPSEVGAYALTAQQYRSKPNGGAEHVYPKPQTSPITRRQFVTS